jgi:UDP-N-acetylglucosamine--N-acetylmuramyl-(pentapeptide) pyrophosphoryl-undecaprenol N-acetylglucosamine transferase
MKVLIAAGGTGGHLFPGVALARELKKYGCELLFVGTSRGIEEETLRQEGFPLRTLSIRSFQRMKFILRFGKTEMNSLLFNIQSALLLTLSFIQSLWILLRERPRVVVGMGGYLSFPVLILAWLLRKQTLISEQNLHPGLTTRVLSYFVDEIHLSFEETKMYFTRRNRVRVSGNPIRKDIADLKHQDKRGRSSKVKTVLIFGGSRGARSLNRSFIESLSFFSKSDLQASKGEGILLRFLFQTGREEFSAVIHRLKAFQEITEMDLLSSIFKTSNLEINLFPFIENMSSAYREADLIVSRAGATTCAEITSVGLPALLVPYPYATEGHQKANANFLRKMGAAEVIQNGDLSGEILAKRILTLLEDDKHMEDMRRSSKALGKPDATKKIAESVVEMLNS